MKHFDILIVGGGASGFFAGINCAEMYPELSVGILERGKDVLGKVKISGGGRCNVTHAEFIPKELTQYYPRGEKELLGPFHTFMTGDTMGWFEERGVALKIEDDGRIFPESDSSQTIIDCFKFEANKHGVSVLTNQGVKTIKSVEGIWNVETGSDVFSANKLIVATGSSPKMWKLLQGLGHSIVPPVPSLFTFNCKDNRINDIPGVVAQNVNVSVKGTKLESTGPLLITHWGFSAPSILKLSAFGALELAKLDYKFTITINFIQQDYSSVLNELKDYKTNEPKKGIYKWALFNVPKRLWYKLVEASGINETLKWADANKQQLEALAKQLTEAEFNIDGKSTFKEEFVTAGGVKLKEVNFKNYQSRLVPNLYFSGEVLNVDAVTGGFNFQNAWTSAYIVASQIND